MQDTPDINNAPTQKFIQTWTSLMQGNPEYPDIESMLGSYGSYSGGYDCVKLILLGLHQFLEQNPRYTPEMLANGSLNEYLLPAVFADTGYRGITYDPIKLDKAGDLEL
ncbi:hypothetical protein HDU76_001428 [Blyttiomyces sp. JEL0837]|nr:hypothetical protein HDU76_001428 [Blyttiomyces sp. JEL0837]